MSTAEQLRAKALSKFNATPTPSAGRILEDATKLVARVVEGLKHEAFEGLGYKAENGARRYHPPQARAHDPLPNLACGS